MQQGPQATSRLLVVEDDSAVRKLIRAVLCEEGFTAVDEAADGEVALRRLQAISYDLVISDWTMPRLGGAALLEALRQSSRNKQVPVLVISAAHDEIFASGGDITLSKPFDISEFVAKVRQLLQMGRVDNIKP